MINRENWPYKWFGIWKETRHASEVCPSIKDFIIKDSYENLDNERIAKYLKTAQVVASTSRLMFPCVLTGKLFSGSLSYRTDGTWLWPDDLIYYVQEHDVSLPIKMIETMKQNNFNPPVVNEEQISDLEWPPILNK